MSDSVGRQGLGAEFLIPRSFQQPRCSHICNTLQAPGTSFAPCGPPSSSLTRGCKRSSSSPWLGRLVRCSLPLTLASFKQEFQTTQSKETTQRDTITHPQQKETVFTSSTKGCGEKGYLWKVTRGDRVGFKQEARSPIGNGEQFLAYKMVDQWNFKPSLKACL